MGAFRWGVLLVLAVLLGVVGFAVYRQYLRPSAAGPATEAADARLDPFLARGDELLVVGDLDGAKEQYMKASGVNDRDPRVLLGLARVEILRAQVEWWRWLALAEDDPERVSAEQSVSQAVKRAAETIERAQEKAPTDAGTTRLQVDRLWLDAMTVFTLARTNKREAADKSLAQLEARHRSHPLLDPLRRLVASSTRTRVPLDAGAEASASASALAKAPGGSREEHFEFDHEPTPPSKSPGELELPGGKEPQPAPPPASDPR